ncbi:MAG TPA: hypothetical protein VFG76_04270 [Candidatus Polarisedimenticolia bacterium]|nr:hypothetical protein [Candidatus Polarisedimenticolia bacterium]
MAKPGKYPGVGARIRERLEWRAYWKDGRPDVTRFCRERGYLPSYVYKWLGEGVVPDYDNLLRLSHDLEVPPAWILFGDEGCQAAAEYLRSREVVRRDVTPRRPPDEEVSGPAARGRHPRR